jgi:hypothetical protein
MALILVTALAVLLNSCGGCQTCGKSGRTGDSSTAGAAASTGAAAGPGAEETGAAPSESGTDSLRVEIEMREGGYALLEPVDMTLTVENIACRDLNLTFPTAQRYDFIIRKGKQVVWQWSEGMMFAQVIGRETLEEGESISYDVTWDQTGLESIRPPLGAYSVQGILKTAEEIETREKEFGIVD